MRTLLQMYTVYDYIDSINIDSINSDYIYVCMCVCVWNQSDFRN